MGNQQSQNKDELLYQQVNYGNIEGIKKLCQEGARLEWIDKEGKTPLIAACLNAELFNVAKALIELGANVNAYRPGGHAGTPLHHAAKRGIEQTVKLLLSHGANAFVMNDDCQTPMDLARVKGYSNVVRILEHHICPFFGWLREVHGPGFLEAFASQWLSKKIWAVVIPYASRNLATPLKLQLAIYSTPQDAQPRAVIALSKAKIEEPKFRHADPTLIIFDDRTKTRYKFASENEGDKQQLQWFYNACKGIAQAMHPSASPNTTAPPLPATSPESTTEEMELNMAINASIQSALEDRPPFADLQTGSGVGNTNGWNNSVDVSSHNDWESSVGPVPPSKASSSGTCSDVTQQSIPSAGPISQGIPGTISVPSAPPMPEGADSGPVHYPVIDSSPIDLPIQSTEGKLAQTSELKNGRDSSSCVICLDAPVEGACIPCGHMVGCMSCLNDIKAKKWGCPICRTKIQQVLRLYAV